MQPSTQIPVQPHWANVARSIRQYHSRQCRDNPKWRLQDTCREKKVSLGWASEALLIARWLITHETEMIKIENRADVIAWIRKKKREIDTRE